jgi:hypothetical protein
MARKSMRQFTSLNPCPDQCSGAEGRQRTLSANELAQMDGSTRDELKHKEHSAMRCSYCGVVYIDSHPKRKLGILDSLVVGPGWHPTKRDF